jgi:hypothetical protein
MSKINYIYRIIVNKPTGKSEEFYTTLKEANFYRDMCLDCNYPVSEAECLIVWNNVMADEPVAA